MEQTNSCQMDFCSISGRFSMHIYFIKWITPKAQNYILYLLRRSLSQHFHGVLEKVVVEVFVEVEQHQHKPVPKVNSRVEDPQRQVVLHLSVNNLRRFDEIIFAPMHLMVGDAAIFWMIFYFFLSFNIFLGDESSRLTIYNYQKAYIVFFRARLFMIIVRYFCIQN